MFFKFFARENHIILNVEKNIVLLVSYSVFAFPKLEKNSTLFTRYLQII